MDSLLKANLSKIRQIMKMHGVVRAFVFGSAATDKRRIIYPA